MDEDMAVDEVLPETQAALESNCTDEVKSAGHNLRKFFAAGARTSSAASSQIDSVPRVRESQICGPSSHVSGSSTAVPNSQTQPSLVLSAFNLSLSIVQDMPLAALQPLTEPAEEQLEKAVLSSPVAISDVKDQVPLLIASAPLLPSGVAIFARLPHKWIDLSGRSDALGTRCLFASRRHEHSVFTPLPVDRLLQVPLVARVWQPSLQVPSNFLQQQKDSSSVGTEEPWSVEVHPGRGEIRVALRPGILLTRMLRRGTALPAAVFAWRVLDTSKEAPDKSVIPQRGIASDVGEFSILCNVEDAAHTQPPRFLEYPLRIEQLRSLGWMIMQERRRRDPFVTELREAAPCADAPHWRLEGSLRCEYRDVKGGVLADAIGYGKTACSIGLIDCTSGEPVPEVPQPCRGFIASRATLVLAPTNLHAQWLQEIKKFTGKALKVLSVPTCAQLKKLAPKDLMEADVVVATYRLFYSTPYLQRLQELARERLPEFAFPRLPQTSYSPEWAKAYREAFESLPAWGAALQGLQEDPVTPAKLKKSSGVEAEVTPELQASQASKSQTRRMRGKQKGQEVSASPSQATQPYEPAEAAKPVKRRRTDAAVEANGRGSGDEPMAWASTPHYIPLEAFWWKRVICDEFHELLSRYPPAQVAVELFHADYKWGLSGTPPCQTLAQIRKAAGFFGVQIPTAAAVDDGGEAPRKVAQEWLDAFVRRNTAEIPTLEEEERIIPVHLTPKERALYSALTQQPHMQDGRAAEQALDSSSQVVPEPPEIMAARTSASGLLKLCSHFCSSGAAEVLSAEDECERQLALRREQVRVADREVRSHIERAVATVQLVRHFEPHFCLVPDRETNGHVYGFLDKESRPSVAARLKKLAAPTAGTKAQLIARLFEVLSDPTTNEQVKEMALRVDFDAKAAGSLAKLKAEPEPTWKTMEAFAKEDPMDDASVTKESVVGRMLREVSKQASEGSQNIPQRCARLRNTQGMPRWPGSIAAGVSKDELSATDAKKRSDCEQANWDWLDVPANATGLRSVITAWKLDIERNSAKAIELAEVAASKLKSLRSFTDTLHASQLPAASSIISFEVPVQSFAKYGSKIEKLVKHVLKLQDEDPGCKSICFVQWEDLKRKISAALTEFGIEHLSLHGSVWNRRAALMRFQYEEDSPRMLILSLEESASGTNLTAANHVLIVHPMEAATRDEAVAFEMQAVGRVRRPGQQRKIHIWRFVTVDTVEQELTEEHQKELWERQHAAQLFSQVVMESQQLTFNAVQEEGDVERMCVLEDCATQLYGIQSAPQEELQTAEPGPEESSTQLYGFQPAPQEALQRPEPEDSSTQMYGFQSAEDCSTQLYMGEGAQKGTSLGALVDEEMTDGEATTDAEAVP